jgi:uncharacterized membrane protein
VIRIEQSIMINGRRDEVFDFLTDLDNVPQWHSGVIQSRPLSEGPVRVGFQFQETVRVLLWKMQTTCTVTDLRHGEAFGFDAKSSGPIEYRGVFRLHDEAGGTRVAVSGVMRLKGVWRLLEPLLGADVRKESRKELESLKRIIEGKSAHTQPSMR